MTSLDLAYDGRHRYLSAEVHIPYRQVQAALRYEWTGGKKQVKGSLRSKGRNVGSLNAAFKNKVAGRSVIARKTFCRWRNKGFFLSLCLGTTWRPR